VEYAAIGVRVHRSEFGPIRSGLVEVSQACDQMLSAVEDYMRADDGNCRALAQ